MSELKATPGEWLKVDGQAFVYALNEDGINRFWMSLNSGHTAGGGRVSREEIEGNAHLMRSAKELYTALDELIYLISCSRNSEEFSQTTEVKMALKALGRARGSS